MAWNKQLLGLHKGGSIMTYQKASILIIALTIAITSCSNKNSGEPAPVIRPQEGAELCDEVAAKLGPVDENNPDALDCDFAYPVPVQSEETISCEDEYCDCSGNMAGCISFEDWCVEQHANGVFWNTKCIMEQVSACEEVETICNVQ